jgi:hypothetical protein
MKKIRLIILISILILCWYFNSIGFYGTFYDGTGARDTVWMNVATFDTLGQQTNADSVWFIRHYRTTAIDTVIMSTATAGTGYYITGKRAFDGTNYGDYTVRIRWKSQTKYFGKTESYTVFPSDTSNIKTMLTNNSFAQIGTDKIWRLRGLAIRGTSGDDTAFIAQGYGYGMGVLAGGGSTGADGFYALGGGTGAGFHSVGGSGDGAEGIFAEGTGSGPGIYGLGGSSGSGLQVIGQGSASGIRADGGSSGNGITVTGFSSGSGIRVVKGSTGYDIYGNIQGNLLGSVNSVTSGVTVSTNNDKTDYQLASGQVISRADSVTGVGRISSNLDKTNYSLNSNYLTKADSGSTGTSYLRAKYIEDKIGYRLSAQGQADVWINDTTGENSGWAGFFKGRLDANVSSRFAPGDSGIIARAPWDNDLIAQAQRRIRYVDSLGEELSGGGSAANPDTIANHVWIWDSRTLTSGAGAGTNQVVITTKQSSDSTPIASVQMQVLNYEQTATAGLLTTNPSGQATFALDNAIYKVRMFKPGWQFTVPESLVVSGNSSATFYASVFDPGLPPSAELCRVYGWIKDLKGLPVVGAVIDAKIVSTPLRYQSVLISPYYRTTNTDSEGYWYLDLYPNSKLSPSSTQYDFTIYIPYGTILKLKNTVPEQSSWELGW